MLNRNNLIICIVLIFIGTVLRILPHPANFAPLGAIALFGGAVLGGWRGVMIPLVALAIGDAFLGFYSWPVMVSVYGSFVLYGLIGLRFCHSRPDRESGTHPVPTRVGTPLSRGELKSPPSEGWRGSRSDRDERRGGSSWLRIVGGSILGSVLFYLITNWAVWAFGTMYPHTLAGLLQSYIMALPFFRNTIAGDLFYTAVLFGSFQLVTWLHKYNVHKKSALHAESRSI